MRYAVLILGILGALGSGFLGYKWWSDAHSAGVQAQMDTIRALGSPELAQQTQAKMDQLVRASYFLMAGLPLGIVGGVLAMRRQGWIAGLLMLIPVALATAFAQNAGVLIFTFPLVIGGLLAFFVWPKRAATVRTPTGAEGTGAPVARSV